jgi:hypothetical protein
MGVWATVCAGEAGAWSMRLCMLLQAAQRGQKAAVMTAADPEDPLRDQYGDLPLVQSQVCLARSCLPPYQSVVPSRPV